MGFKQPDAGGLTLPGGSASNSTSMVIARNTMFPETKAKGNGGYRFVVFTSVHGHYSVEKSAILCGFGSEAVLQIPVDQAGRMVVSGRSSPRDPSVVRKPGVQIINPISFPGTIELEAAIIKAKAEGYTPFYVNAGAGTTVLGSYDPFPEIAAVCKTHNLWFHVDGSWGGSVIFSENQKWRLKGVELADSMTVNPHKMLGVPMTCSFLLTPDRRRFRAATQLKAE